MRQIITESNIETITNELDLQLDSTSHYALVENGQQGLDDCINIYFDPDNLSDAKLRLQESGYYKHRVIRHLMGKQNGDIHIVALSDIVYIEGINNDTFLHTKTESYQAKEKLYQLEQMLSPYKFVRISKSYIVSLYKIQKIKTTFQGKLQLLLTNDLKLDVTRHYVKAFKDTLGM